MLQRRARVTLLLALGALLLAPGCNLAAGTQGVVPPAAVATSTDPDELPQADGMQVRFLNVADGGTVPAQPDDSGRPVVHVRVEVTGTAPLTVGMTANGLRVFDEAANPDGQVPFTADLTWNPLNGGGEYALVVTAMTEDKQVAEARARVTVTGVPEFTATPPPLDAERAQQRFRELYLQLYGVDIPAPSMQRFDFPDYPQYSRWISAAYYGGQRYYIQLYDDTHYDLTPAPYAEGAGLTADTAYILCRPAGHYTVLVVFVDYGNTGADRDRVLAQVQPVVDWTNRLYTDFAVSRGFTASPLSISADAVYVSPAPDPGSLITEEEIRIASGLDPAAFDFVIEIDLDSADTLGQGMWKGYVETGGGLALQGCGARGKYAVNIWSSIGSQEEAQGGLVMDFNHELSHLFGMLDDWPFEPAAIASPDGSLHDDWIPYVMLGWTDTDADGVPEIVDPTPYGTTGPQP